MSIRLRLTIWYAALLAVVITAFAIIAYFALAGELVSQFQHAAYLQAIAGTRSPTAGPAVESALAARTAQSAPVIDATFVQVTDFRVRPAVSSANDDPLHLPGEALAEVLAGRETSSSVTVGGDVLEIYTSPLLVNGEVVGMVQVAADMDTLEAGLGRLRLLLAGGVVAAIAFAGSFGWYLAGRGLRPVSDLTGLARRIGRSTDLSLRLDELPAGGELGLLASTFNEMLGRIEQSVVSQQRFVADASHELRTPLASIRMNAEALGRANLQSSSQQSQVLRALTLEADRMARLVGNLLVLARADAGQNPHLMPVELDALVLEAYGIARSLHEGAKLCVGELAQVQTLGDPDLLKQVALNLLDNGLRYAGPEATVTVDVCRDALDGREWAVLRVRDDGPGIAAEHLPHIFERFYRVGSHRSASKGGTGLGLAICESIARMHGGRIEAQSRVGEGSAFTVLLPVHDTQSPPSASSE